MGSRWLRVVYGGVDFVRLFLIIAAKRWAFRAIKKKPALRASKMQITTVI
jgi:hypothetical protein